MKICFITGTIFNLGGVQRVLSVVASELSKDYQVTVLCMNTAFKEDRSLYNLSENVKVEIRENLIKPKSFLKKLLCKFIKVVGIIFNKKLTEDNIRFIYYPSKNELTNIIKYIEENNFDYVIGLEGYYSMIIALISENLNAKTIGWQHNSFDSYFKNKNKYYWGQEALFYKYMPLLDGCIVLTQNDREKYRNLLKINNCTTIYNPLSFKTQRKTNCLNKNILFVGRLIQEQKGLDLLIEVFSLVIKSKPDWKLSIVGDGPDYKKLVNMISEKRLEKSVKIFPNTNKVRDYYVNSSLVLSTSRWEGFGLVITEAMECGVPVVAFDNSGPKEIIEDNINGLLVKHEDVNEMVRKILYLIDNKDIRLNMSRAAIKRAEDFNCDVIIEQWNKYFSTL